MQAMVLRLGTALQWTDLADQRPGPGEIRVKVAACGVCRTDLHVVDGELPDPKVPIIPGHEIVGRIDAIGAGVEGLSMGERVGIPWLGHTCGVCPYCMGGEENLCDQPSSPATRATVASRRRRSPMRALHSPRESASGARPSALRRADRLAFAGDRRRRQELGLYGFGAAAHIVAQVAKWQGRTVFAFTRPGDVAAQTFARRLGAIWKSFTWSDVIARISGKRPSDNLREISITKARLFARSKETGTAWRFRDRPIHRLCLGLALDGHGDHRPGNTGQHGLSSVAPPPTNGSAGMKRAMVAKRLKN